MKMLKKQVGRPSKKTFHKRKNVYIVLTIIVVCFIVGGVFLIKNISKNVVESSPKNAKTKDTSAPVINALNASEKNVVLSASDNVKLKKICVGTKSNCKSINFKSVNNVSFSFKLEIGKSYTVWVFDTSDNVTSAIVVSKDLTKPTFMGLRATSQHLILSAKDNYMLLKVCMGTTSNCKSINKKSVSEELYSFQIVPGSKYTIWLYDTYYNYSSTTVVPRDSIKPVISSVRATDKTFTLTASDDYMLRKVCVKTKADANCREINKKSVSNETYSYQLTPGTKYTVWVYDKFNNVASTTVVPTDSTKPVISSVRATTKLLYLSASDNVKLQKVCVGTTSNCKSINKKSVINQSYSFQLKTNTKYTVWVYDTYGNYQQTSVKI